MTTAPNLVVAGHPGLSQMLRNTGRFPAVFDVTSAAELWTLSRSGKVRPPATFLFAPGFNEDIPDAGVADLASELTARGFTVLVHSFFTERGDRFGPGVAATKEPMSMSDLLTTLGAGQRESLALPDLHPEPPPEPWAPPEAAPAGLTAQPVAQPTISDHLPSGPAQSSVNDEQECPEAPPGYGVLSILHRGVSAVTYCAVHEELGTVVALRVRRDGAEIPPDELAALERASRSDHLATVLECGRTPTGRVYTASVHCPRGAYAPGPPLPFQDAVGIAVSAGKGLRALHKEGLVHGDVHHGRILRDAGAPLLTGAATLRGLATLSAPGVLEPVDLERIDPAFAAPEVLRLRSATAVSDVYGLGATLWSMLAGHAPFTADDRRAVRERAQNGAVPRVPRNDVPEWLANVLAKATAHDPADRYPTARAFTDALEEGLRDVPESPADPEDRRVWPVEGPRNGPRPLTESEGPPARSQETAPEPPGALPNQGAAPEPPGAFPSQVAAPPRAPVAPVHRGRKPVLAAAVVLVLIVSGIGAAGLIRGDGPGERRPRAKSSPPDPSPAKPSRTPPSRAAPTRVPTSTPTAVRPAKEYVPGQVRIVDGGVSIEVTWKDRSGGRAAYYLVGGPTGRPPSTLANAPRGTEKVMIAALNPSVNYCLTVVAVVDVDRVAQSKPVCTRRVKRDG